MHLTVLFALMGVVQGLTEFLPVSSSGHLVILRKLLGLNTDALSLSVVLHLGTTFALILFFFKEIIKMLNDRRLVMLVILTSLITGTIGIAFKDFFERLFSSAGLTAVFLAITGLILIFTKKFKDTKRQDLNFKDALIFGLAQGAAIVPGISRSGITISTLLFRKIDRKICFNFSFIASIPAVLGATVLQARHFDYRGAGGILNLGVGFLCSFIVGLSSLRILGAVIRKAKLFYFGYYCIIAALIIYFIL